MSEDRALYEVEASLAAVMLRFRVDALTVLQAWSKGDVRMRLADCGPPRRTGLDYDKEVVVCEQWSYLETLFGKGGKYHG